jgi:malate dehydrogenase (oxaloacetate-decarboxylating)(NADP+)
MADRPVVFAMANPDPEITYEAAKGARGDVLVATGRSDFPNQVNNVLGFPYIFRGALDVRATCVNEEMKIAAVRALAALAKEDVPDSVISAYSGQRLRYGMDYIIPKPFDPRVLTWVAPAVARAAMESSVARVRIDDFEAYRDQLEARLGKSREISRVFIHKAKQAPKRIVFTEGEEDKILRASQIISDEKIAEPILLGRQEVIRQKIASLGLELDGIEIVDPLTSPKLPLYTERFYEMRQRRGVTLAEAHRLLKTNNIFGMMMLRMGDAAGLVSGITQQMPDTIRPALQIIKPRPGVRTIAGVYMLLFKTQTIFIADATINIEPTAEELAEIAILAAHTARRFDVEPRVAMLSFSNFGSTKHPLVQKVSRAVEIVRSRAPSLLIDGEMMGDIAVVPELLNTLYPFNELKGAASVLVFPDLCSANISYRLLARIGGAVAIGPILTGMNKPIYLLQMSSDVNDVVNMTALAVVEARDSERIDPLLFVDSST